MLETRDYELVVLLHPDLELDLDSSVKKIEDQVVEQGGKVIKRDNWGKKKLAYPVGQHQFAVYVYFLVQLEPGKTEALNRSLRLSEEIIRYMLVSKSEAKAEEKPRKVKKTEVDQEKEAVNG